MSGKRPRLPFETTVISFIGVPIYKLEMLLLNFALLNFKVEISAIQCDGINDKRCIRKSPVYSATQHFHKLHISIYIYDKAYIARE